MKNQNQSRVLSLNKISIGNRYLFFSFNENNYTVSFNKSNYWITCTCFHGSVIGVHNIKLCRHKKLVLDKLGLYRR